MKIRWKKVLYFVMFLGSFVGFKNAVGQNDTSIITEIDKQNKHTISGHITNNDTKSPLPFCNVILYNTDKVIVKIVQSDFDGYFQINFVPKGLYKIKISFIDYLPQEIPTFEVTENIDLKFDCSMQYNNHKTCYLTVTFSESDYTDAIGFPFRTYRDYNIDGRYWNKRPRKLK